MEQTAPSIIRPLFMYRLDDEMDRINDACDSAAYFLHTRYDMEGNKRYKVNNVRKGHLPIKLKS